MGCLSCGFTVNSSRCVKGMDPGMILSASIGISRESRCAFRHPTHVSGMMEAALRHSLHSLLQATAI